jgi:Type IIA topoisomerase (DNA gyrase/topo II, topoisomerase IV), B subunit
MKDTKAKTFSRGRTIGIILLLAVLAVSVSVLVAYNNKHTSQKTGKSKEIHYDISSDNLYAWTNDGLVIASGTGISLLNEDGDTLKADTAILQNPALSGGNEIAAAWSVGAKDFYTISKSKGAVRTITDRQIININVNEQDWLAVSAQEDGYKGAVSVFNNKLKTVYKWSSGEGYLVNAVVSDSSDKMAALTINESGSKVHFFNLNSTEQKGSYTSDKTVLFDLAYLGSSSVCALSDSFAVFLNEKGNLISKYDFTDGYLKDYSLKGSGFAALVVGKYKTGSAGTIVTLSPTGTVLGKLDASSEILSVSARGKFLAVLYSDALVIYRSDMTVYARITDITNVRQVLMRSDGSVVMFSSSGAAVYKP